MGANVARCHRARYAAGMRLQMIQLVLAIVVCLPLPAAAVDVCPHDDDASGAVEVDELVRAIDAALRGCGPAGATGAETVAPRQTVERAYAAARAAVIAWPTMDADELWALVQIVAARPDAALASNLAQRIGTLGDDPLRILVDAAAPRIALPEDPGTGIQRWSRYVVAPLGTPLERAVEFLVDYLAVEGGVGYVLTHQVLGLLWAEQTGLELPVAAELHRPRLLAQLAAEQQQDTTFSDLFSERLALLLAVGDAAHDAIAASLRVLLAAQGEDGLWPRTSGTIEFDGGRAQAQPGADHTLVLALWALRSYLDRCPHDSSGDGTVDVVEVVEAVSLALAGCSAGVR